jgi:hypothetical protein
VLTQFGAEFGEPRHFQGLNQLGWIAALLSIAWLAPNTQQIMARYAPALDWGGVGRRRLQWQPTAAWAIAVGCAAAISIASLTEVSQFLYFQF